MKKVKIKIIEEYDVIQNSRPYRVGDEVEVIEFENSLAANIDKYAHYIRYMVNWIPKKCVEVIG